MIEQATSSKKKVTILGKILVGFIILSTIFAIYLTAKLFIVAQTTGK
jgi:hypothetical protein